MKERGAWTLERVELRRIAMPLVAPFRTSFGSQTARDILLVRCELAAADGRRTEGWGDAWPSAIRATPPSTSTAPST